MIKKLVEEEFALTIKDTFKSCSPDIINFLSGHERKSKCIENVVAEIRKMELGKQIYLDRPRIQMVARDVCKMFCQTALRVKEAEITNGEKKKLFEEVNKITTRIRC